MIWYRGQPLREGLRTQIILLPDLGQSICAASAPCSAGAQVIPRIFHGMLTLHLQEAKI